mgnify:CR=1 FL=1
MYKEAALGAVMALGAAFLYGKSHEAFSGDVGKGRNAAVYGRFCGKRKFYILKCVYCPSVMRIMIVSPESFINATLCAGKTKYKNFRG